MSVTKEVVLKAYNDAWLRVQRLGQTNTYGLSQEERIDLDRRYSAAIEDLMRARAASDALHGDNE